MIEYVKKADVLEIVDSPLPRDIAVEYLYELKGVWLDEDKEVNNNGDISRR